MIPFNRAEITDSDRQLLISAIERLHISGNGFFTRTAESSLQSSLGVGRALLTTSCTHALEMSALLAKVGPGDEVIVPSFTFVSTASAFLLFGATPVFVDVEQNSLNIDSTALEKAITPRTKAICVVHYGGIAADLDKILEIAKANVQFLCGANGGIEGICKWPRVEKVTKTFDQPAFIEAFPDIAAQFMSLQSQTSAFIVDPKQGY